MISKTELIKHFGSQAEFARFMGQSRASASQLPDTLTKEYFERVVGAMVLKGLKIPEEWLKAG